MATNSSISCSLANDRLARPYVWGSSTVAIFPHRLESRARPGAERHDVTHDDRAWTLDVQPHVVCVASRQIAERAAPDALPRPRGVDNHRNRRPDVPPAV